MIALTFILDPKRAKKHKPLIAGNVVELRGPKGIIHAQVTDTIPLEDGRERVYVDTLEPPQHSTQQTSPG